MRHNRTDSATRTLIIQIPCYNEEEALPVTLKALPTQVEGYDRVEVLVIDDGSTDRTVEIARALGVAHIVSHGYNRGLAATFMTGIETALRLGAHTIVNLDADNQYCAEDIPLLVKPILEKKALITIGTRPIATIRHFSFAKKCMQWLGSFVVRILSGTCVADAPSGFRAMHRDVARQIRIFCEYSYTIEMIIQLGSKRIPIQCVPIRVNEGELRPSRLVKSNMQYVVKSIAIMVRVFVLYRPMLFFTSIASLLAAASLVMAMHASSPVLALVLMVSALLTFLMGLVCDGLKANRTLLETLRHRLDSIRNDGA